MNRLRIPFPIWLLFQGDPWHAITWHLSPQHFHGGCRSLSRKQKGAAPPQRHTHPDPPTQVTMSHTPLAPPPPRAPGRPERCWGQVRSLSWAWRCLSEWSVLNDTVSPPADVHQIGNSMRDWSRSLVHSDLCLLVEYRAGRDIIKWAYLLKLNMPPLHVKMRMELSYHP